MVIFMDSMAAELTIHIFIYTEEAKRELEPDYNTSMLTPPHTHTYSTSYALGLPCKNSITFANSDTSQEPSNKTYESTGNISYSKYHIHLDHLEGKYF